jgi:D-aminopeptidase
MPRVTDLGITIGLLPAGPTGSVLDVPGAGLGHATVWRDEAPPPAGRGTARTGVTVLDPGGDLFAAPVPAGAAVLNGAGECTGLLTMREWGLAETPVFLTSTMQVGRVYDAACELLMAEQPAIGTEDVIIPIVAECDDSFLSEARRMQVEAADVRTALLAARESAGGAAAERAVGAAEGAAGAAEGRAAEGATAERPSAEGATAEGAAAEGAVGAAEGSVGAGTGMTCLGYKGGIGTSSRVLPDGHTVGVVTLTNFGDRERLTVAGVPAGRLLPAPAQPQRRRPPAGSCIVVVLTDGPLDAAGCSRLARRAELGLARTGSTAHHGSGEIFLALATGLRAPRGSGPSGTPVTGRGLDTYFDAAVEATEEAVLNSLLQAQTVTGRDGNTAYQLPADLLRELLAGHPVSRPPADLHSGQQPRGEQPADRGSDSP